jgi:O-acetyl-ADP-ribose deacetylase (regulator of RNase III)
MIEIIQGGNIFNAEVEALVNPTNVLGVMGKGLALAFKNRFPRMARAYLRHCLGEGGVLRSQVIPGETWVYYDQESRKHIICFATKGDWRKPSRIEYIKRGMARLAEDIRVLGIRSIAIPALGCGEGGLDWNDVRPLIEEPFGVDLPNVRALLFPPR